MEGLAMQTTSKRRGLRIPRPWRIGAAIAAANDATLNRWLRRGALILVIGVPLFAGFYYLDRHIDSGPTAAERAIASAEVAVRAAPNDISIRLDLAAAYLEGGRGAEALAQLNEVLRVQPENRAALIGRAQTYRALGETDRAADDYTAAIQMSQGGEFAGSDPQLEGALYQLGMIRMEQGRAKDALPLFAEAVAIDDADADALLALGTALIATGDPSTGVIALRRAAAFVPTGWCDPYAQLRVAYEALGNRDGTAYAGGMVSFCEGRDSDAIAALEPLAGGPLALDVLIGLGLIAEAEANAPAAAGYYERALAIDPKSFLASKGLGRAKAGLQSPEPSVDGGAAGAGESVGS